MYYPTYICVNKECGKIIVYDSKEQPICPLCNTKMEIGTDK